MDTLRRQDRPPGLGSALLQARDFVLDLLYPPRCGGCGAVGRGMWCAGCASLTRRLGAAERCKALELDAPWAGIEVLAVSAAPYAEPLRQGIHEFKYNGAPDLARPFGLLMAAAWLDHGGPGNRGADVIAPVPLHSRRQRERGYNQSELLGRWVSRETGIPLQARALRRVKHTEHQARLGAAERRQNVLGAFAASPQACAGRRILVIDDVLTTGTTLRECAAALLSAGAAEVAALTLARASD
jgi:ComF family protein